MEQQCIVCVLACVEKCMCVCMHVCGGQRSWGYFLGVNQLTFLFSHLNEELSNVARLETRELQGPSWSSLAVYGIASLHYHIQPLMEMLKIKLGTSSTLETELSLSHNKLFSCRKLHCPIAHMKTLSSKVFIKKSPGIIVVEFCDSLIIDIATVLLGSGYLYAPSFIQ